MKRKAACGVLAFLLATVMFAPSLSLATTYNWVGGSTGYWHVNTNWSPTGVPNSGDTALVTAAGSIVNLNGWYANMVGNLTIASEHEVQTTITSPNYDTSFTFAVPSGSASLTNNGIFRLADTGKNSWIYPGSSLSISGTGRIIMESSAKSRIYIDSPKSITNGANHTIEGVGNVDPFAMSNYGMIQATGNRLMMARGFNNYTGGVLRSNPGAVLQLGIWYNDSSGLNFGYDGRGGVIDLNGGTVKAELADFTNADIRNSGSGGSLNIPIRTSGSSSTLYGNTKLGSSVVLNINAPSANYNGNSLSFSADLQTGTPPVLTNDGVINVQGGGNPPSTYYYSTCGAASGTLLTGSGRLVLNGNPNSQFTVGFGSAGLTQDVNHTIEGGGMLMGKIVNNGTILANNSNLNVAGNISGTGQVKVQDGGRLVVGPPGEGSFTLQNKDLLMSSSGAITVGWNSTVNLSGDFSYAMTDPSKWTWDSSTLKMSGSAPDWHFLEVGGRTDLPDPFVNNFALSNLVISGDIALVDLYHNTAVPGREALYVNYLTVSPGATLNLNNLQLFCYLDNIMHQVRAGEGALFGGGQIINRPLKPVTTPILLLLLGD